MNSLFWKNKKVFITGHTGFKGSWLSLWLQTLGADVTGYSLTPATRPSLFELANVESGMNSIINDIRELDSLSQAMQKSQPEIIFHLAAQALVRKSYINPIETYSTNVMGTINLFESIKKCNSIKAVVNITSDKCYENKESHIAFRESDPMGGFDPYSNSKGCVELITNAYRNSFFNKKIGSTVNLASARAGNVIGGGDWAKDRLIPDILEAISIGKEIVIRNPQAIRPWQHVLDPLSGYFLLAQKLYEDESGFSDGWNFGPHENDVQSVQWIVEKLISKWGNGCKWRKEILEQPHEATYLRLDCSKAREKLGWQPKWSIEEALNQIIDWQKAFLNGDDMRKITLKQIVNYENCQ